MAYYLSKERETDVMGAYKRYQDYLHLNRNLLPPAAFELGTAEWYPNPNDHRCPHDGQLPSVAIMEPETCTRSERSQTSIRIHLSGTTSIEFFYPKVFSYSLISRSCTRGLGDWRYDEFRVSPSGHLLHEIEWAGFPHEKGSRWIIEASDVEFRWAANA